jgi:hypothetical protein
MALTATPNYFALSRHGVEGFGSSMMRDAETLAEGGAVRTAYSYVQDGTTSVGPYFVAGLTRFHVYVSFNVATTGLVLHVTAIDPRTMAALAGYDPLSSGFAIGMFSATPTLNEASFGLMDFAPSTAIYTGCAFAFFIEDALAKSGNGNLTMWADHRLSPDFT